MFCHIAFAFFVFTAFFVGASAQSQGSVGAFGIADTFRSPNSFIRPAPTPIPTIPSPNARISTPNSQLSSSFQLATQQAIPQLESNPTNLDQVLDTIAQAILGEIQRIVAQVILGDNEIDTFEVTKAFGEAVKSSLESISQLEQYGEVDVDSVVAQVESEIARVLVQVSEDSDVGGVTEEIVNAVVGAIGDAISEVTGAVFTYEVNLSSIDTIATNITITDEAGPVSSSSVDLLTLLQDNDVEAITSSIATLLEEDQQLVVLEFLNSTIEQEALYPAMVEVLTAIFGDVKFPQRKLVEVIGSGEFIDNSGLAIILEDAILAAVEAGETGGLLRFINSAFLGQSELSQLMIKSMEGAIGSGGCSVLLADLLTQATKAQNDFLTAIAGSAGISSCLSQGFEIQFPLSVVDQIQSGDIDSAYENIKSSQVSTIVASFVFSLSNGIDTEVAELLSKFYEDEVTTVEKLGLIIALFLRQDFENALPVILESVSRTQDLSELIATFKYALTEGEEQVLQEFVSLIAGSVDQGECGLGDIIAGVMRRSRPPQVKAITQLLVDEGLEVCVPGVQPVPIPNVESEIKNVGPVPTSISEAEDFGPESEEAVVEVTPTLTPTPAPAPEPLIEDIVLSGIVATKPVPITEPPASSVAGPPIDHSALEPAIEKVLAPEFETSVPDVLPLVMPSPIPSLSPTDEGCMDVSPPGGYSCQEQYEFGKCARKWMIDGGFCAKTCGFCCDDVQPDERFTCAEQKAFGKCSASWMIEGKFCRNTCGNCNLVTASPIPTPIPTLFPTPAPTPSPASILEDGVDLVRSPTPEPNLQSECNCGCAERTANLTAEIVKSMVLEVLKELKL
eukprot:TRINITY_DN99_c1_g1_i1.p1 TRINITY_DN99_c1_g1~~TRINITY_DN99_c1_g1_i1.p1  ORF type:complete len:847 (-),score=147.42 TRINITY_DN99_c1_g1_i1:3977-6517(-)